MKNETNKGYQLTVTAIIPTYNRARYLRQSLDSVIGQTRPAEQIIVVDDGSTDETQSILADYGDRIEVLSQANAGKPAALNRAIRTARGSHIWIFDDDDLALPHALGSHVAFLENNPEVDFSYSRNYVFRGDDGIENENRWRLGSYHFIDAKPLLLGLLYDCELIFQALLVPKACFVDAGYFVESLAHSEDYDMLIKLARRYRGGCNDTETMVWRDHSGERGPAHQRHRESERTKWARHYERQIFSRVWNELSLTEYRATPSHAGATGKLAAEQALEARLERCEVMFRHDLPAYAGVDLAMLVSGIGRESSKFACLAGVICRAADVGDPVFVPTARNRARHLARAISGPNASLCLAGAALKGFYWSITRSLQKRHPRDVARMLAASSVFVIVFVGNRMRYVWRASDVSST